jgi:hypothetical protein
VSGYKPWWQAEKDDVNKLVIAYVQEVERVQSGYFDRLVKIAALYDPSEENALDGRGVQALVSENVVASNVDTVTAIVAASEIRARFMTDDGDWSTQRRARHLERYADGLSKLLDVDQHCVQAFKDGALKGTGIVKVYTDSNDQVRVERVVVDDIIVDQSEARVGPPRQIHQRCVVSAEQLVAMFPEHEDAINAAVRQGGKRTWAEYRPIENDEVVCIESWRLPWGTKGKPGYVDGRHTITIDGADLSDEPWHKEGFPFAVFRWSRRDKGWYGIGLGERLAGHQRLINKTNWQIDRAIDQAAVPTTYVSMADANIAVKTINRLGSIAVTKSGQPPVTVTAPAVSAEVYNRQEVVKASAFEESGVSRMAAQSMKPGGLDSGAALREYRDATTQRFAQQEKGYERLKLDVVLLALDCCKDLGKRAPVVIRKSKHGPAIIEWKDVDPGENRVQIAAASNMAKTPAGRTQLALEWAQAGIISQDEARRLMQHPDTERSMSLYTAALDDLERCIEEILDGAILTPEPYQNLKMLLWRGQAAYLKACSDGAPEEIKESFRSWMVQAAWIESQAAAAQPQPTPVMPSGVGADPMGMPADPAAMAPAMPMDAGAAMTGAGVAPMAAL